MSFAAGPPPILSLLADPRRWQLMAALASSDRRVGELTDLLGVPQNLVSYHLRELRNAGLVRMRRSSADRRDIYYCAELTECRRLVADSVAHIHPALALRPAQPVRESPGCRCPRVLFLCTGNSARSQMAEAMLVQRSAGHVEARSAGSHPKPLHLSAVAVMRERGIDIGGARSKHFRRFTRTRFDRIITLCDKVREICPEFPGPAPALHWSIPDPAADGSAGDPGPFRAVADEIEQRIELLLAELAIAPRPEEIA